MWELRSLLFCGYHHAVWAVSVVNRTVLGLVVVLILIPRESVKSIRNASVYAQRNYESCILGVKPQQS